jgi:hypothetical protein
MKVWNQIALGLILAAPMLGQTVSTSTSAAVPILLKAALPYYPPIGLAAHITGKVVVRVTVKGGQVVGTDVVFGARFLQGPTLLNLKTWQFATDEDCTFTVTYTYKISGVPADYPTNPQVEMLPSLDVKVTARPVKPTVMYGK